MTEIKPVNDKSIIVDICTSNKIEYFKNCFYYGAFRNEKIIALCGFYFDNENAFIKALYSFDGADDELLFTLVRCVMSFLCQHKIKLILFCAEDKKYAEKTGFYKKNGKLIFESEPK